MISVTDDPADGLAEKMPRAGGALEDWFDAPSFLWSATSSSSTRLLSSSKDECEFVKERFMPSTILFEGLFCSISRSRTVTCSPILL
eukprot:5825824-Pyramimonas_sp.AAC.1